MESIGNYTADEVSSGHFCINILNLIFKECPEGIVYKDKNLNYLAANPAFCKLFRLTDTKELLGKEYASFLTSENAKIVKDVDKAVKQEQKPITYLINDNEKIYSVTSSPIMDKKNFLGVVTIAKDITHEENIKEKFVLKHFQLKSLLENIPMLIYMQDANQNYIAGTKPSQSFVKDGFDAFSNIHIDRSCVKNEEYNENHFVLNNNQILVKEKEFPDFKGTYHRYKIYKVPINDFNGNVTGIITLANNIDAEKQLQTQRETFVASIGHDLKNPTIAQMRGLELLLKGDFGNLTSEQTEIIEMILDSCRYMNGMLSSLLATYRNYDGAVKLNFEEFSLPDLVMECVSEMIYVAKDKNVGISIDSKLKNDIVIADRVQIKRVIMNLLSNGIKYAYKDSLLSLNIYSEGSKACFEFENESPYIPKDMQRAIFAQYVSYASTHNELGIGLGLYASKKIIEAHSGKIFVHSSKDEHNRFGFKIPAKHKHSSEPIEVCF